MKIFATFHILGGLLMSLAGTLLAPIPFAIYYNEGTSSSFLLAAGISFISGLVLYKSFTSKIVDLTHREGFAIVTFGWIFFAIVGSLPYIFTGTIPSFIDAFFESMSGFTTTGSTIITNLSLVPKSVLFWRAETQWLGGMGIIVLTVAVLPFLGVGGAQLFQAEVPGPTKDKLSPRIQDTAKLLWGVYFFLTFLELILLILFGTSFFDAICHAFTTMATGGFSTYDASVAAFQNSSVHWIITIFMFMAGVNFTLHYQALSGRSFRYFFDEEFRLYLIIFLTVISIFTYVNLDLYSNDLATNIRNATFQAVSVGTSTGYANTDYEKWPFFAQYILVILMIIGSCAGSTGGGAKVVRILIIIKHSMYQIFHLVHPKGIKTLKINQNPTPVDIIQKTLGFFILYVCLFIGASLIMTALEMDLISAGTSVIACLSNIGPGLGSVGPTDNFAHIAAPGKIVLSACMLIGRLELFTVLVLFSPSFWKG